MAAVHLTKTYCLPTLMCGCEIWTVIIVCTQSALHATTFYGVFLSVVGVRALNLFSFSAKQFNCALNRSTKNDFFGKKLINLKVVC